MRRAPARRPDPPARRPRPGACSAITGSTAERGAPRSPSIRRPTKLAVNAATYQLHARARRGRSRLFVAVACDQTDQRPMPFLRGLLRGAPRAARRHQRRHHGRDLERAVQRSAVPLGCRPRHADDRHAAGTLSLCRHPLVLDHVRPRRPDHRAADAVVRIPAWRAACCAGSPPFRPSRPTRAPTRSPARSCTRCAPARWRRCARCRSASTTAASIRRRCSCCWPALYVERTGDDATLRELWPAIEAALGWIDGPGDPDRRRLRRISARDRAGAGQSGLEGFARRDLPRRRPAGRGADRARRGAGLCLRRQARGGALRAAARACGDWRDALDTQATRLAERFEAAFWCPEIGTYALALDGAKRAVPRAHLECRAGAVHRHRAPGSCRRWSPAGCMEPRFFSGWGIRTVARGEARYNPMSYHNGSIWPHDNALIALGLARYGLPSAVEQVFKGLFDAATYMDLRRLPELFCGFQRQRGRGPTLYPVACAPQAWASATPFSLLEASLGLEFDPRKRRDPLAQSAAAGVPRRGDAAQSAARPAQRRSAGAPPRRRGLGRYPAHPRQDPGFGRLLAARNQPDGTLE